MNVQQLATVQCTPATCVFQGSDGIVSKYWWKDSMSQSLTEWDGQRFSRRWLYLHGLWKISNCLLQPYVAARVSYCSKWRLDPCQAHHSVRASHAGTHYSLTPTLFPNLLLWWVWRTPSEIAINSFPASRAFTDTFCFGSLWMCLASTFAMNSVG